MPAVHRVLLVDDDLPFCEAVTRLLAHHRVATTAAPAAALAMLAEGRFDLAIIDVRLWPIDGFELAADMLRRKLTVPVLLVTGGDVARVREMADDLLLRNVSDVLAKPLGRAELEAAVERAVTATSSERITRRALAAAIAPPRSRWS